MITEPALASCLEQYWNLADVRLTVHNGGMSSATWVVSRGVRQWVAKVVAPHAGSQFAGGLAVARSLEIAGISAGAPVPAQNGQLAVDVGDGWLALLTWVPGEPLAGQCAAEQEVIGTMLARVHRALSGQNTAGAQRFHWVDPHAAYLSRRPWLRPAITAAVDALDAADPGGMTWGILHADPSPDVFRLDPHTGRCGVIDWGYFIHGPLLYDIASAVMYVGGATRAEQLVRAYLNSGLLDRSEVHAGLEPMLRFRWAVQANYFAWRIAENDLTGISGPDDNEKFLADAQRALLT